MKNTLKAYTSYNLWANNEMIKCVEKLTQEQLHQTIDSSFNSVFKTILHIWDAEYIWLQRMQGKSINDWPSKMMDKEGFSTNLFLANSLPADALRYCSKSLAFSCSSNIIQAINSNGLSSL